MQRTNLAVVFVTVLLALLTGTAPAHGGDLAPFLCNKLVADGVAASCSGTSTGAAGQTVHFEIVGLGPRYRGTIAQYKDSATFSSFLQNFALLPTPADDYPNQYAAEASRMVIISWSTKDGSHDAWDTCRERKTVSVCAREHPAFYASFQRLHAAALAAVSAPVAVVPRNPEMTSEGWAVCLTPFVLLAIIGFVLALVLRRSSERRAQQRAAALEAMHAQEARNAWHAHQQGMQRLAALSAHFGPAAADRIMRGEIWQGQTEEMLRAARGIPADIDVTVLKTKRKLTYKYNPQGGNRYGLRVFLEDGAVIGWEDKR